MKEEKQEEKLGGKAGEGQEYTKKHRWGGDRHLIKKDK